MVGVNISFSYTGLRALGISDASMIGTSLTKDDEVWKNGALNDAKSLKDPMSEENLLGNQSDNHQNVDEKVIQALEIFGIQDSDSATPTNSKSDSNSSIRIVTRIVGDVRPGDQNGHEHFGFLDGVSNPLIVGFDAVPPGPAPIDAKFILTGHDTEPAPAPGNAIKEDWTKDGSFLVFRYLTQQVPEFNNFLRENALQMDHTGNPLSVEEGIELLASRLVGRWKSGAPIDVTPFVDNPDLVTNPQLCPWAAHIRRSNPRQDVIRGANVNALENRMIIRRGIPFGPELTQEEITSGLSKMSWANNPKFPFVSDGDPQPSHVPGIDSIIGRVDPNIKRQMTGYDPLTADDPSQKPLTMPNFVIPRGGGYFFTPSMKTLREINTLVTT